MIAKTKTETTAEVPSATAERERVFDAFRRWGYLEAELDPLGYFAPERHPELALEGEAAEAARKIYCGSIGAEFAHIPDPERRRWIQERLESEPAEVPREAILEDLVRSEIFEDVLHSRYPGTKRFSLEGVAALIPLLEEVLDTGAALGAEEIVLGMSHRGRLNVMAHTVGKAPVDIVAGFEDVDPRSVMGAGDVKYHVGSTAERATRSGREVHVRLASNPSHLEAIDPVVMGRVRAKQTRLGADGPRKVLPVLLHGDAAFAGQGIAAETLNLADIRGFSVGGTVHVIVN
ncbi:MAG: thiamine pyrophosphate-dependent enzyme, partial [Candidatus Acidiferrales bacterium]